METVAFYSYKGGVGRTLLLANTAQFLARSGRRVVALDLDLEAPGLHQKLGDHRVLSRARTGQLYGAVNQLLRSLEHESPNYSVRDTAVEVSLPSGSSGSLHLIPAGCAPYDKYWEALERLNNSLRTNRREGGLPEAVLELQQRIDDELAPNFLLVDCRAGITELGGLATSILADRVVCLTTTAPESVEGTRVVADALRTAPRLSSQQPLRIDFLITRVTSESKNSTTVAQIAKDLGGSVAVLPHDSSQSDGSSNAGNELFSATLAWIAKSFPG